MSTSRDRLTRVRCRARWLDDEPQPGWVLYEFRDANGQAIFAEDKPIWTEEVIPPSGEPIEAWFAVTVVDGGPMPVVNLREVHTVERWSFSVRPEDVRRPT